MRATLTVLALVVVSVAVGCGSDSSQQPEGSQNPVRTSPQPAAKQDPLATTVRGEPKPDPSAPQLKNAAGGEPEVVSPDDPGLVYPDEYYNPGPDEPSDEELQRTEDARLEDQIQEACADDPSGPIC
jgi:hypothetical protein